MADQKTLETSAEVQLACPEGIGPRRAADKRMANAAAHLQATFTNINAKPEHVQALQASIKRLEDRANGIGSGSGKGVA